MQDGSMGWGLLGVGDSSVSFTPCPVPSLEEGQRWHIQNGQVSPLPCLYNADVYLIKQLTNTDLKVIFPI